MLAKIISFILLFFLSACSVQTSAEDPGVLISGKVLINDKVRHEEFVVQVVEQEGEKIAAQSEVDEYGNFEMTVKDDGEYIMKVVSDNNYKSSSLELIVDDNKVVKEENFNLIVTSSTEEDPAVKGVVDYPPEVNYVDVKVVLTNRQGGKSIRQFTINKRGEFQIHSLNDGTYYLCAQGPNDAVSQWVKITIEENKLIEREEIKLELK